MSKKDVYKTVKKQSQSLLIEKKSKFIANVKPVDNEDDALAFLNEMRSKYSDATHNVYAYVIDENNIFRYSDDGEPSGTAGMPVLDAIRKSGIVDVVVVVTRYFGGTLLGTGGLVHTYGASAKQGLIAHYSVRSAVTGSLFDAFFDGIRPPRSVKRILSKISTSAGTTGSTALTSVVFARLWIIALTGIIRSSVNPIPISPAHSPIIKVSALNTWETFRFDAPMALRIPISFLRSNTLI